MDTDTPTQSREDTPDREIHHHEATTTKKTRFYEAWDTRHGAETHKAIGADLGVTRSTASRWLKERTQIGSAAYRRTRKRSNILGRRRLISKESCLLLVNPAKNPVQNQHYEAQMKYHKIKGSARTLQRALLRHTNKARRYKAAYVKKKTSNTNRQKRTEYGRKWQYKTVENHWRRVLWTDEAHIDPTSNVQDFYLREQGKRYKPEYIQERGEKRGVRLHIAGWCNWHAKCEKLQFYHDEEDEVIKAKKPRKPRKTKYCTDEEYAELILKWEAECEAHDKEVKPKGNSMTGLYYAERLLPFYIDAIQHLRITEECINSSWLLQEDGDKSHGIQNPDSLASVLKRANWITNLVHPPQSPDLNPIEALWNILKQRIRRRVWNTIAELKEVVQDEWSKITMEEVRARIADMPRRCKLLVKTSGKPIKTAKW